MIDFKDRKNQKQIKKFQGILENFLVSYCRKQFRRLLSFQGKGLDFQLLCNWKNQNREPWSKLVRLLLTFMSKQLIEDLKHNFDTHAVTGAKMNSLVIQSGHVKNSFSSLSSASTLPSSSPGRKTFTTRLSSRTEVSSSST